MGGPHIGNRLAMGMLIVLLSFAAPQILLAQQTGTPYPQNGDMNGASPNVTLTWTPGRQAAKTDGNDVYFGTDATKVLNATHSSPEWMGAQTATSYACSSLTAGTTYYWRVDALNPTVAPNLWTGAVWSFKVFDGTSRPAGFTKGYATWTVNSMTKVNLTDSLPGGCPVGIKLAQCESGSFQIAVQPASGRSLDHVRLEVSDLTSGGNTIAASNISWLVVGVINDSVSKNYYPDILLPVGDFNIATGNTHSMLVTTTVPLGQAAGTYTGTVTVKTDSGLDTTVNVTLTVFGFAIPPANTIGSMHLKSSWTLGDFLNPLHCPRPFSQEYQDFGDLMLNYRMNPDDIYRNCRPDIATLEHWHERGLSCFSIQKADSLNYAPFVIDVGNWLTTLAGSKYGVQLRSIAYFYGFDEKPRDYCELSMVPVFSDLKSKWPDIPNMNTSHMYVSPWPDPPGDMAHFHMDWVCAERSGPLYTYSDGELLRQTVDPYLLNSGRYQYWAYNIGMSVGSPFLDGRRIFWSAYQQKADGVLHYNVNGWAGSNPIPAPIDPNSGPIIPYTFPRGDDGAYHPESVYIYYGTAGPNGTAVPLASMRMVSARDGMQDWEYLWAIGHYDTDGVQVGKIASVETARELAELIATGWDGDTDPTHLLNARDVIAGWLTQPYVARYPMPEHRSKGVNSNPTLSWQADSGVNSFDVYFGTDKTAVLNATPASPEFKRNQTATTYSPVAPPVVALAKSNVKYYWRIDEVVGATKYKGYVWSFECGYGRCGWWKFDEASGNRFKDWSGLANDGTISGTVNHVAGALNNGAGFVQNGSVSIPPATLSTLDRQVTVSFWQYGDPWQPQQEFTFQALTATGETVISGEVPQGNGSVRFAAGTSDACIKAATLYQVKNRWNHWAFTKNADTDPGVMNIYLNGVLWATATGQKQAFGTAASFRIGAAADGSAGYEGALDDFQVYDVELSQAKIKSLYDGYNRIGGQGLVGHWSFDEPSGNIAYDDSDYLNHGTIFGATRVAGKVGKALSFSGTDYVDVPVIGLDNATFPDQELTVSVWTWGDASLPGTADSCVMHANHTTPTPELSWYVAIPKGSGLIEFAAGSGSGGDPKFSSPPSQPSDFNLRWNHWVFTRGHSHDGLVQMYVNGHPCSYYFDRNYSDSNIGTVTSFRIGADADGASGYKGLLDEVRLYNYALTETDVANLHDGGPSGLPVVTAPSPKIAMVGRPFAFQIMATNSPTRFATAGLPSGLTCDTNSGLIHGTPTCLGTFPLVIYAFNAAGYGTAPSTLEVTGARLLNISTRGWVDVSDRVLIAGFIVSYGPTKVLVRGLGPSLTGVTAPLLQDPMLTLYDVNRIPIGGNDNWKIDDWHGGSSQEAAIIATTLPPVSDLESAILINLTAGTYTVILKDKDPKGTGVGLIEVYDLGLP